FHGVKILDGEDGLEIYCIFGTIGFIVYLLAIGPFFWLLTEVFQLKFLRFFVSACAWITGLPRSLFSILTIICGSVVLTSDVILLGVYGMKLLLFLNSTNLWLKKHVCSPIDSRLRQKKRLILFRQLHSLYRFHAEHMVGEPRF